MSCTDKKANSLIVIAFLLATNLKRQQAVNPKLKIRLSDLFTDDDCQCSG